MQRLTREQVQALFSMFSTRRYTVEQVADHFGTSVRVVEDVLKGEAEFQRGYTPRNPTAENRQTTLRLRANSHGLQK